MTKKNVVAQAEAFVQKIKNINKWDMADDEDEDDSMECAYCGTFMFIQPSGKYYMPWTSNQTARDVWADELFWSIVGERLPGHSFVGGDGDPCDCFCYRAAKEVNHA